MKTTFYPEPLDLPKLAPGSCILVDGDPGAGKTALAGKIAGMLGAKVISIDNFLLGNNAPYLEQIKYDALKKAIQDSAPGMVVIEGSCALQALRRIGVRHQFHVFAKCVKYGEWKFKYFLDDGADMPETQIDRDVVQYYREFKPFEVCDLEQTCFVEASKVQ